MKVRGGSCMKERGAFENVVKSSRGKKKSPKALVAA